MRRSSRPIRSHHSWSCCRIRSSIHRWAIALAVVLSILPTSVAETSPLANSNLRQRAAQIAKAYGINPKVFVRQINTESGFNPNALSPAGARGIAQFMPATAHEYGVNTSDPISSLRGAAKYDRNLLNQNHGDYRAALSAYNSGSPTGYQHIAETRNYVSKILGGADPAASVGTSVPEIAGTHSTQPTIRTVVDPSAVKKVILANLLTQQDPNNLLLKLGVVSPGMPTTRTIRTPGVPAALGVGSPASDAGSVHASSLPKGVTSFEGKQVAKWIAPYLEYARAHGWKGTVTSGYRSYATQQHIYNSGVRPAAKPGTSNHEFTAFPGGAVDASDAQHLAQILAHYPGPKLLQWAGSKDPVHFSHPHGGSY